jgi:hypothetical protein
MKNLLYKEARLALHPTSVIFLSLSAMMLIPDYPYYVIYFYTTLGIFFTCLGGRENHDIFYTMLLPVRKEDIVKARFVSVVVMQLAQIVLAAGFATMRRVLDMPGNQVGMDANIAFFGFSFLLLGLFNLVFFTKYYQNTDKVGFSYLSGSVVIAIFIVIAESSVHMVPFMRDCLDTRDPEFLGAKLLVLAAGMASYVALTLVAYRKSTRSFELLDL